MINDDKMIGKQAFSIFASLRSVLLVNPNQTVIIILNVISAALCKIKALENKIIIIVITVHLPDVRQRDSR